MNDLRDHHYVPAEPHIVGVPRADLVRRQDVVEQVGRMLDIYDQQQRAALATAQQDIGRGGYLSTAEAVAERRKTSRLYLLTYFGVSGVTVAGLVTLAALAGAVNTPGALAAWLALTGITTLVLAWIRHGDEFKHSPEGIARHLADWYGGIAEYEAETRRLSIRWEFGAEQQRREAAAQASADARQQAQLRIDELAERRRINEAQHDARLQNWQTGDMAPLRPRIEVTAEAHTDADAHTWQEILFRWIASLYAPGALGADGFVIGRIPWSARAARELGLTDDDCASMKRVCLTVRPSLFEQRGNNVRLRIEMFETAEIALRLLKSRV